jgi:D-arabinose 1-dehydrogenase-like Zn-dependent alcohol dehydrogenase
MPSHSNDRVGIGYVRGGCGSCTECRIGYNFFCKQKPNNYNGNNDPDVATWATHAVLPAIRLAKIPDAIPSEYAGPLMCAGQTVWLPFARTDIRPWHTVGIIGIGGLGHLAIQFASKMGCNVVVFSGSASKREEAMRLGASEFYTADDLKKDDMPKSFVDHLLVTTSQLPDWDV